MFQSIPKAPLILAVIAALTMPMPMPQAHAEQPIRLIVGYAPGGGVDTAARIVAKRIQQNLGQSVIVENRPGAGGIISANALASSPHDGSTLLMAESAFLITPHLYKNVTFSIQKDFEPIGMVARAPLALASSMQFPATTLGELIALLKKSPGKYSDGTPGIGTLQHLSGEVFKSAAQVDMLHVPYHGGLQVVNDLMTGGIDLGIASFPSVMPLAKGGKIRIIAIMSDKRQPSMPSVPTVSETLPGFSIMPTLFILAPAGTSPVVVAHLNQALQEALRDKGLAQAFEAQGMIPEASSPAELATFMRNEEARWATVVHKERISIE